MKKYIISISCFIILLVIAFMFYTQSTHLAKYLGLSTVPCQDTTLPILQQYSLIIKITVDGKNYPLDPRIGHDFGNCLHDIYVNDNSGKVYVKSNDKNQYTLGQFFDIWHVTFNKNQMFGYQTDENHPIQVKVNGNLVITDRDTLLRPNEQIEVIYQ